GRGEEQSAPSRDGKSTKNPPCGGFLLPQPPGSRAGGRNSGGLDVRGLLSLGSLGDFEAHLLAFLQRFETVHLNGREMREQVLAAVFRRDEAVTLRVIEPLDRACCHRPRVLTRMRGWCLGSKYYLRQA